MKKIICKKLYDTDSAELIEKKTHLEYGNPKGYEEALYKTRDGRYFLYTNGGGESKYPKENITRKSEALAKEFLKKKAESSF